MDAPEELRQAVATAFREAWWGNSLHAMTPWDAMSAAEAASYLNAADAVLAVPAIEAALAAARACEQDMARLIEERDEAQGWADLLAACAGGPEVIGEHSNANNPWANALDLLRGDGR